ncbi:MAG: tetratricopeptide repeat protein [Deltaproteobacteria bacterium]|nr:tetratricopeptide repeat protein [Deltaproteobacteria bacterium]
MTRSWVALFSGVAMAGAVVLGPRPATAAERALEILAGELAALGIKVQNLAAEYDNATVLGPEKTFSERLTNGEILYLLADYQRASLVLYDLVERREHEAEPLYPRALYFLAESLYQIGHDLSARRFFERVIARRDQQHLKSAVRRLIQICDRTRHWEGLEEQIRALGDEALPKDVAYVHAKSLLRQGKLQEAITAAKALRGDAELGAKAAYLEAVGHIKAGELDQGRAIFDELLRSGDSTPVARQIRELAAMNRGRIFFEEGKLSESVDAYQAVERKSPLFEEALYEVTWTYVRSADAATDEAVRAAEYKKAENALEILLLSESDNAIGPEARLLLGNILLRLGQFGEATKVFGEVVDRYRPVRDAMSALRRQGIDPGQYFDEVVGSDQRAGVRQLPSLAVKWARQQRDLKGAQNLAVSLTEGDASLKETDGLIDKLLVILDSDKRTAFFPTLQDAQSRIFAYRNSLLTLSKRLLVAERNVAESGLDEAAKQELQAVLTARAALEPAYLKLPQVKEDYEGRLGAMQRRILELQQKAYRLRYDIDSLRAQLAALRVWITTSREQLPDAAKREYDDRLEQQDREVVELEGLHRALEAEINHEKGMVSITTATGVEEDSVRAQYAANLAREREILMTAKIDDAKGAATMAEIERLRGVIDAGGETVDRVQAQLDRAVAGKADQIKATLLAERGVLESYRQAMDGVRVAARGVVGEVAATSLSEVEATFASIVLRGDVGVVDVAWALKEVETHEISKKVNEQRRELQILDSEFAEILREE